MNDPRQPSAPGATPQPVRPLQQPHTVQPHAPRPLSSPAGGGAGQPQPARPVIQPRPAQGMPYAPSQEPMAPRVATPHGEAPISLVEDVEELVEEDAPATPHNKIVFGPDIVHKKHDWKRKVNCPGNGACRVKSFHGKLSDQGMEFLDDTINVWLDAHPEIEVKFVTSTVGMYEGKFKDLALILNVWY